MVLKVRRTRSFTVALAIAALLAGACSGGNGGEAVTADDGGGGAKAAAEGVRELAAGNDGAPEADEIVATSAEEWSEKWAAAGATAPVPDVGDVDFTKEVAVAIFAGERPSGGWKVDPEVGVKRQGVFASIDYVVVGPGEGCSSSQAITSPYLVLAVKGERIRFVSSERKDPCE